MWSIWLCGRLAGQVRPRTVRDQPGRNVSTPGPPEVAVAGHDARAGGAGKAAAAPSRRSWIGGPYGRREVRCTPIRSTSVPPTSSTTCSPPRSGVGHPATMPTASRPCLGREAAEDRQAHRAEPVLPSRGTCGHGSSRARPKRQLEDLGIPTASATRPDRGNAAVGRPRLLHDDDVGVEPEQEHRVEVVGLAHAVVGAPAGPAWQLKLADGQLGHPGNGRRSGGGKPDAHPGAAERARPRSRPSRRAARRSPSPSRGPSPRPPASRARPSSSRVNRSNTRSRSSTGMPGPSSSTVSSTSLSSVDAARPRPPCVAWRAALSSRLRDDARAAAHAGRAPARRTRVRCRRVPAVAARCRRARARRGRSRGATPTGAGRRPRRGGRARAARSPCPPCARPRPGRAAPPPASRRGRRCGGRPRGWCGSTRAGCAARATRRTRTGAGAARRRLEPVEHRVHRAGEPPHLVVGVGLGHPPVDGGAGDRLRLLADRLDRLERASGEVPGSERDQDDHRGHRDAAGRRSPSRRCGSTAAVDCCATRVMSAGCGVDLAAARPRSRCGPAGVATATPCGMP